MCHSVVSSPAILTFSILLSQASCLSLQRARKAPQVCLEDVCIDKEALRLAGDEFTFDTSAKDVEVASNRACEVEVPSDSRLMLLPMVPAYHGSTALESVLMSGKKRNLSTLCSYNAWQCEGKEIMAGNGYDKTNQASWNYTDMMRLYSKVWDLSKPILLEKTPVVGRFSVEKENKAIHADAIPSALAQKGVSTMRLAYIFMWRPYCLGPLSKNFDPDRGFELKTLKVLMEGHKYVLQQGDPVLVINYADMLWMPSYTKGRVQSFLPCVGGVDFNYVPKLGEDIFPGNVWKQDGSVSEFGASLDPEECCGYSVQSKQCTSVNSSAKDYDSIKKIEDYFASYS